jgi:glutathionylspermidine synthase
MYGDIFIFEYTEVVPQMNLSLTGVLIQDIAIESKSFLMLKHLDLVEGLDPSILQTTALLNLTFEDCHFINDAYVLGQVVEKVESAGIVLAKDVSVINTYFNRYIPHCIT